MKLITGGEIIGLLTVFMMLAVCGWTNTIDTKLALTAICGGVMAATIMIFARWWPAYYSKPKAITRDRCRSRKRYEPTYLDRILSFVVASALIVSTVPVQAQAVSADYSPGYSGAPSFEGMPYDYARSIEISLPPIPQGPERNPIVIGGIICAGMFVGVIGWIGIKIINAALNVHELQVTNNAAQPWPVGQLPLGELEGPGLVRHLYYAGPVHLLTDPTPPPIAPTNGIPSHSNLPPSECTQIIILQTLGGWTLRDFDGFDVADAPILVEHSFDGTNWTVLSYGITRGTTVAVPDSGVWRLRPALLQPTVDRLKVPPGILQASRDLRTWEDQGFSSVDREVIPVPGTFYRLRLPANNP